MLKIKNISKAAKSVGDGAANVIKNVGDGAHNIAKTVGNGASTVAKKSGEILELSKLNLSISSSESKLNDAYMELGKLVYSRYCNNQIMDLELTEKCNAIFEMEMKHSEMKEKIHKLRNIKTCPNCSYEFDDDDIYCPKCGIKLNSEENTSCKQRNSGEKTDEASQENPEKKEPEFVKEAEFIPSDKK